MQLSPLEKARLSARLLQLRGQLTTGTLNPIEKARASSEALSIRAKLGAAADQLGDAPEAQAAFDQAKAYYQEHLKGRVVKSVIGPVTINGQSWNKLKQYLKLDKLKYRLVEHIVDILETGKPGQRVNSNRTRPDGIVAFHFISKEIRLDDLLVTAGLNVGIKEDGQLVYSLTHSQGIGWKTESDGVTLDSVEGGSGAPDSARMDLPRSGDTANGAPKDAAGETVADESVNIIILSVEQAAAKKAESAPAPAAERKQMVIGTLAQKNGGVLVMGDPDALEAYARAYLDQLKYTKVATGLLLPKSQARQVRLLPVAQDALPSGAVIYTYDGVEGVAVAVDGKLSGIARNLPNLKSLMAQEWGADKYRAVFGEDAAPADVQAYQDEQAATAQRKAENAAREDAERLAYAKRTGDSSALTDEEKAAIKAENDAFTAEWEAKTQADWEATVGQGRVSNPRYQAYLDTLEDIHAIGRTMVQVGYMGWVQSRLTEYRATGVEPMPYTNGPARDAWNAKATAYIRQWADQHLSSRVKQPTVMAGPLEITAETPDATIEGASDDQLKDKLQAVAKDFYRGLTPAMKDVARRLDKGTYDRAQTIQALKQNRNYLIERVRAGAESDADIMARMGRLYGDKSLAELQTLYQDMGGQISATQTDREISGNGGRRTAAAVANEGARAMGQHRLELGIYIKARQANETAPQTDAETANQYPLYQAAQLYHGTALPFTTYTASTRKGSGYDHQGKGFYLTTDKRGYARFFAMQAADKILNGPNEPAGEDARILEGGGVILDVSLAAGARIIDLSSADADPELLGMVGNITEGQQLRERVLAAGYDGVAFVEPNHPEGWAVQSGAVTVVVYNADKATISGFEETGKVPAFELGEDNSAEPVLAPEPTPDLESAPKPAAPAAAPEIIEYITKKEKVLRGIIRTDLTLEQAKAIDPYTWRMNGGYFIREKHLGVETSHIQASPVPVVLTPEQIAEKQARDARLVEERQQQALANQVSKLRETAAKAVNVGNEGMNAERKTNTSRRAGMAASAYARAANDEAEGLTLNSIADALEAGAAGPLAALSSRAQLQELKRALARGKYEVEAGMTYAERRALNDQPPTAEALQHVRMPSRMVWSNRYQRAAETIAKKAPTGNSKLIAALRKMGARTERWELTSDADIAMTRKAFAVMGTIKDQWDLKDVIEMMAKTERLKRMGITNDAQLQDACRALLPHLAARKEESAVTKAERAIIGQKVGIDFFPTPAHVAHRMAKLAKIVKGMRVLEPSAGNGNLADAAAAAGGEVDVIEISSQLRDILTAKGYNIVDHDFNSFTPEAPYAAILMNPPFSNRQDAAHIMRAYGMLAGGGTLVAIAGEGVFFGKDQKAEAFRAWLEAHNAEVEKLDGGTFKDDALLAQTSANARLIVLRK